MASFALHSFFQDISVTECNRQQGKDIIEAIKYNPDRVFIIEVNITSAVDVRYLVEISRLPDFNKVSATHKAVLAALIRFVRLRLYPSTCKLTNLALWDVAFLQGLHSQLLQRVADSAAPRVLSVWLDYNRADNIASLCRSCCRAADAISSGNLESFKALVQTERQRVASFALQQLPDLHGWTFLHLLVSCTQHTEEVAASFMEFLLSNSVNLNAVDYANRTALHVACEHFHLPAILLLATHPLSCVTALNSHGKIPLQVFLGQLKVHRHVPDYQQLVRVVQALTPYEDYTALLLNCSASSFRPGLLRGLLHSSREVAYFCINKLSGLVIASGTRSEGYLAVYTTLVYCVKHCVNFYFSQLIDIMKGMASSQDWQLAEWQLFCAMVHYGTLHRNVVAIYWAVDHLCRHTSFDSEDVDMAARMGLLAKHSLLQAVRLEDDKLLASLIRKLPVVFTVVLLTESGATSSPNSVKQFQAVEYISAEDRDVLQQYSLLELACAHHAPSSLAVLLKHLHIHSRHAPDLYANAYRDALAVSVCTADLVCIDTFRDCLGMEVLAGLLFSSGKRKSSVYEIYMHHLRTVAFRRHSTAGAQRATSSSGHMGMLDLLAKLASNAKHLGLYAASDYSAGVADLPKETFSDRASRLQAIVHQKLLLDSSLGTQRSTTSALPLIAQIAEAIPAASKLSSSFNIVRGRWETAKYTLGQSRHRLRIAMRKLCRGFVPDQKWLHLGLCIATLFDALPDQPSVKLSSVAPRYVWSTAEKWFGQALKSSNQFDTFMGRFFDLHVEHSSLLDHHDSRRNLCRLSADQLTLIRSTYNNASLVMQVDSSSAKKSMTALPFSKDSEKNRRYVGDNDVYQLFSLLDALMAIILDEHDMWYAASDADTRLLIGKEDLVAGRDCPNIEQLTQVAQCLSPLDWLLILHCQLECERLTFMEYFDLQHKSQSTLASVCLILPSISAVPAEATRSNQLTLLASTASPSRTWNQSSMSAIVSRSCNGLGEDEVMLACLRIEHELIEQQSLYKKRRIMLPLILPLCNHKCYEAAKFILAYLKREAAGAASHELLDLHYMSNLGYILPSTDFSQPAVLPLHETYCKPHHHRLSVLTPIHFAILHGRRDILGLFMDCFPLFKVDYHQLRAFVCMHGLHSDFCYFIYLLDNLHMTLFIPSVISASGVSDCFDVLSGIDHVNRHIYLAQLTDSAVLSVQSLRWRLRNDYCLYSSIMGDIERFALPFEIQLAHQGVNRTCVDCESDINVLLMDKTLLPAKAVQSSAYNLARAMPIQLYSQSAVFSLVHAVVFCDQLSNKDRSIILEDFLSLMPSKAYRFMQLHSSGVNSQCQPPLDRLLISQEFALSKQVLRLICETANLYLPSGAVPDEAALQSRLYEKLVYYCSYHPNVLKPLELTQCNFLFTVLQKNEAALSKLSIRNELCLMLKHNLQRLQGEFDIQYVGFDAVLQRQLYLKLGSYKTPTLSADFSDFMIFLPLLQQFTTHLFGIMTRPLLTNSYKVLCDHPMRYFMQYSLSSSFEKFDIFVRARQVLSILNIPFSQLAQTSSNNSNSQIVETDDDGDFKTLRLCESLSISSFHALKDLVSGFYNIRSQLDAMPNRHENVPVNCEFARIGPKQLGFAKLKTEECLISYHAPFASFVELGSSGLTVPQFMRRRKLNSSGRPSVEGQYAYKTLSQTNENFDLMRVLHLEAKGHSMPATIKHGNNSAADSVANIDMETQASASLMIALDMAYLIMEFGRFIALQKTLILCSSTCSSITASHNRAKDDFDTSGSYLQKLLQRQELHPLYAQQKERDALLQEQKIIKNVSAIHTLFEPPNRNSVSLLPLKGYDSRLCICDGLQGGMLKMLFHLNVGYSARITKMRDIVSGLVVNLLIDLGHVNYAELICRVLLSHSQKSSGSKSSFSLADKKHVDVETVAPDGRTKQSKSYVKAEDKVEAFQHILSILQSLSVQMLVSLNQQDNVKRFRKEFERLQSWLNGVVDPSDEKIDPKEWKDSIYSLRRGEFLAPNRHEVTYVMNILTDFQTSKDMRSSKKVDVINEAVSNLHVMCHTLSVLYWHVAAIYGLVAKNSGAARGCPEVQVSSRVLYEMIADSRRHLSNHDTGGILSNLDMRSDAVKKLLSLGCQITSTFPTSPPSMSVLSSLHRNSSDLSVDRLSLIEVAALYGDAQMLQQLLETCFLSNNNTSSAWEQLKLAKTLVFACLLAMPGSQKVYLRKQYYKCIELLLEYNFPLCSPSASLSTLDLCVVQQATPVLSALLTAYMGAVASDRALHKVPILSTDEVIEMKFAPHMWALVGSNKADLRLGNECKHKLLSLLGWRLGHVKELKPIDLESLLQKSMEELQPYLLNLRHVLPSDGFCGDISEDHSETIISHLGNSMRKTMSALIRGSLPLSWAIKRDVGSMYSYCPLLAWPQKSSSFSLLYLVVRLPQIGGNADQYETYFSKCQSLLFTYESIWSACCYVEDLQHDSAFDVDTWSSSVQHSLLKELVQVAMGAVVYQNAASLLALHSRSCDLAHGGNTGQDDVGRKVNDLWLWVLEAALECSFTSAQGKQGIPRSLLDALLAAPSLADHETLTRILTLHKKCFNLSNVGSQRKFSTSNVLVQAFVRGVMTGTGRDNQLAILLTHVLEVATMHDSFSSILNLLSSLASTTVVQVTSAHYRYSLYYSVVIHNMVSTLSVLLPILPVNVHEVPDGFDLSLLDMAISLGFKEVTNKLKPFVNKVLLRAVSKMIYFLRTARFRRLSNTHGAV